jgi:integrase
MDLKGRYERAKEELLHDRKICEANRKLFQRFFEYEEYKLKRKNSLAALDAACFKTLSAYVSRLRTVNQWFGNKPWKDLTKGDIKAVYDGLEDGTIRSRFGKPIKDKRSYYNLVIRSKPFELAGKLPMVTEVMEFVSNGRKEDVRFIREETFRQVVDVISDIKQRCFLWLCWDIGENALSILHLRKRDCVRQQNPYTQQIEYIINLRREILKRSRTPRSEPTNYIETVHYLDLVLKSKGEDEILFDFGARWAAKFLGAATKKVGARCLPGGQPVTLKDLRSSMACDLLSKGWSRDEVNARLGHTPSSREIDKYINYLAIDRKQPKRKFEENLVAKLEERLKSAEAGQIRLSRELETLQNSSTVVLKFTQLYAQLSRFTIARQLRQITEIEFFEQLKVLHSQLAAAERELDELVPVSSS